jgi:dienelactone hydrolase
VALSALAQQAQQPRPFVPPDDVAWRKVNIMSEGVRMHGEVFTPKSAPPDRKLPTILMAHGWGGTAMALRRDAVLFARAGYYVLAFDYRGWGESDSRVILTGPPPAERPGGKFTAEVMEVREVVDPLEFVTDWFNAIHWLAGEPQADMERLGLWGSSFSGGLTVYVAARDPRVKAVHSQVGALDGRLSAVGDPKAREKTFSDSTRRARGELGYPAPGTREVGNLRGAPIWSKFLYYAPVDDIANAPNCAFQFVIAEKEELFDNKDHAIKAYERARGPKRLITVPGITHYGIYQPPAFQQSNKWAIEWFDLHLRK